MGKETVLVTGGAGYIGSHLVRQLIQSGYRVRVLDKFLYGENGIASLRDDPNLDLRYGDICNTRDVAQSVSGVSAVVALAALVGDAACDIDPREAHMTNFESTRIMLDACKEAGVRRLVFASSCSVYGANGNDILTETSALNPVSLYARTRIMSEDVLLNEDGPVEVVILRLSTVCGLSQRMRFDLMVNTITARASVDRRVRVVGASQWRPHIHVQDAAAAFLRAVEAPAATAAGQIFNVGHESQNFTIGEVADKVVAQLPETNVEYSDDIEDRRSYRVSFDRIRAGLGFEPSMTVDDAIREVRELLDSGAVENYGDEVYHNVKQLRRAFGQAATA